MRFLSRISHLRAAVASTLCGPCQNYGCRWLETRKCRKVAHDRAPRTPRRYNAAMSSPPRVAANSRRRVAASLCLLQAVAAVIAAPVVWTATESLVIFGPLLAVLGLALAVLATSAESPAMLLVGLLQPAATGALAALIAAFDWNPSAAAIPAALIFGAGAVTTPLGAALVMLELKARRDQPWRPTPPLPRFTIRSLLVVTTTVAVSLAAASTLSPDGDFIGFALYAALMAAAALTLSVRFAWHYAVPAGPEPHAG